MLNICECFQTLPISLYCLLFHLIELQLQINFILIHFTSHLLNFLTKTFLNVICNIQGNIFTILPVTSLLSPGSLTVTPPPPISIILVASGWRIRIRVLTVVPGRMSPILSVVLIFGMVTTLLSPVSTIGSIGIGVKPPGLHWLTTLPKSLIVILIFITSMPVLLHCPRHSILVI